MQVQITGKHVDVGDALRARVADAISNRIEKYFDRGGGADVVVYREGNAFKVDCAVQLANGQQLTTHGLGGDAHMAFDSALEKMERRVRRYSKRLKDHHQQAQAKQAETAAYFVLQPLDDEDESDEAEDGAAAFPEPVVIAETEKEIRTMTVKQSCSAMPPTADSAWYIAGRTGTSAGSTQTGTRHPQGTPVQEPKRRTRRLRGSGLKGPAPRGADCAVVSFC
jgi:ribosomal subunit interface protein